jgi:HEAT repeat protein
MARFPGALRLVLGLSVVALLPACASSGAVKAAESGDVPKLRAALTDEVSRRKLDGGEARSVAHAVATHEIATSTGDEAVKRVDEVRACAAKVDDALDARAKGKDDAAAEAALVLVDAHLVTPTHWKPLVSSEDGGWRAVGARGLVAKDDGPKRRELFLDNDPRVRKAAIDASEEAGDVEDLSILLETVRLDPDRVARASAARIVGEIGGRDAVLALKDRYPAADEPTRAAIVSAWGAEASYGSGGREELLWAAETEHGVAAINAASALSSRGGEEQNIGRAAMTRAIREGGTHNRMVAISLATLADEEEKKAIVEASEGQDMLLKIVALGKLSLDPALKEKSIAALEPIAATDIPEHRRALQALAQLGDRKIVALLANETSSKEPHVRVWAAQELAGMKEFPQAAMVLADDDVSVRTRAACAILNMRK